MQAAKMCWVDQEVARWLTAMATARTVALESTVSSQQLRLLDEHFAKCASFAPGEARELFSELDALSTEGRDPLISRKIAFENYKDRGRAAVDLFANQDFSIISELRVPTALIESVPGGDIEPEFNGKKYIGEAARATLYAALELGSCRTGEHCQMDLEMHRTCMLGGRCVESREEYCRPWLELKGGSMAEALALSEEVRKLIEARNVRAFAGTGNP